MHIMHIMHIMHLMQFISNRYINIDKTKPTHRVKVKRLYYSRLQCTAVYILLSISIFCCHQYIPNHTSQWRQSKCHIQFNWIISMHILQNQDLYSKFDVYLRDWQFVCLAVYLWFPALVAARWEWKPQPGSILLPPSPDLAWVSI